MSGEETFALAHEGDPDAYREVFVAHHAPLFHWTAAELLDPDAAREIVGLCFARGWERIGQFPREDAFVPWLFRTARALVHERLRARRRAHERPAAGTWREEPFNVALALLPEGQRAALVMREWGGLSYDEIALRLGVGTSAVRSRLSLAREAILRRL
jgi:RNA polymerase sigma-70 factor (ECF subfamily)